MKRVRGRKVFFSLVASWFLAYYLLLIALQFLQEVKLFSKTRGQEWVNLLWVCYKGTPLKLQWIALLLLNRYSSLLLWITFKTFSLGEKKKTVHAIVIWDAPTNIFLTPSFSLHTGFNDGQRKMQRIRKKPSVFPGHRRVSAWFLLTGIY